MVKLKLTLLAGEEGPYLDIWGADFVTSESLSSTACPGSLVLQHTPSFFRQSCAAGVSESAQSQTGEKLSLWSLLFNSRKADDPFPFSLICQWAGERQSRSALLYPTQGELGCGTSHFYVPVSENLPLNQIIKQRTCNHSTWNPVRRTVMSQKPWIMKRKQAGSDSQPSHPT